MDIEYRKILPSESKLYREIRLESLKVNPERFYTKYENEKKKDLLSFEAFINKKTIDKFVIGAFQNNQLIGICSFAQSPKETKTGELIQLFVKPDFRKNNIGFNLVKKIIETAFDLKEITEVILDVLELKNDALKDFYLKAGFKVYNQKNIELNGQSFGFIQMKLKDI